MKMAKNERQEAMLKLVRAKDISTQEELARELENAGWQVTQATVSRDIKDLGIIKVTLPSGGTKYSVLDRTGDVAPGRLLSVFSHCVLSCEVAMNLVVVKTLPGMANAAASALDSIHLPGVVGTIAGDDTVFIATPSNEDALAINSTIKDMNSRSGSDA
ncbi:MAG: arginine repressor [Clostridiales bacterium]|nr:arginine repressor [Clostridiales bacterium]